MRADNQREPTAEAGNRKAVAVNLRREPYDVYVGRGRGGSPGKWGNPFSQGAREQNVRDHAAYVRSLINSGELTKADFRELEGKRLGCFCKPGSCHADVLADIANNPQDHGL